MSSSQNKIEIGNKNKISNSVIGNNINTSTEGKQSKINRNWILVIFWKICIPIIITIVAAFIIWKLGFN